MCNFVLRIAAKCEAAKSILHFLHHTSSSNHLKKKKKLAANIANGNTLPIAADYVWKILAFWSQDSLGTTYKLHKIKFHF